VIGTTLAHYRITAALGAGGMGEVWRAEDTKLGREVALKVLPEEFAADPQRLDRFEREARAVASLNHPHIVTIHSVEEADGVRFLTMELIEGRSLDKLIPEGGLDLEGFFELATPLAEAISAAHDKSVIHRDLKPSNVMVDDAGRVKVLDFGLAKLQKAGGVSDSTELPTEALTGIGMIVGTVPYMSPEQIEGKAVDHRTDIFSLGVLLYEMATGERPFSGDSQPALMSSILKDAPQPVVDIRSDFPRHLGRIIARCLEKDRRDRYQTARVVFNELKALLRESSSTGVSAVRRPGSDSLAARATRPSSDARASQPALQDEGFWVGVLPFKFSGGDTDLEALAEGLSEGIGTGLSRFSYLRVVASGSKVGDARYLLEGSLRRAGTRLRIAVQLVDTISGAHLWAETYDRTFSPEALFELQDDLVPRIVSTVADMHGILPRRMSETVRLKPADQLTPYEALLHSFGYNERFTPDALAEARSCLERAVEQSPGNADCWAMLSLMYSNEYGHWDIRDPDSFAKALRAARKAVLAAPLHTLPHYALAQAHFFRREFPAARTAAERAVSLNPMDGATAAFMGLLIAYSGDWERGCALAERAWELNPNLPGMYNYTAWHDAYRKEDYRRALELALELNTPENYYQHAVLTMCYAQLGEMDEAHKSLQAMLAIKPDYGKAARQLHGKWIQPDLVERLMDGLRKAGLEIADDENLADASPIVHASGEKRADEGFWVAVLPFKFSGGDTDLEALAEGLSEGIGTGLSRFSYLRVVASGSKVGDARYLLEGDLRPHILSGGAFRAAGRSGSTDRVHRGGHERRAPPEHGRGPSNSTSRSVEPVSGRPSQLCLLHAAHRRGARRVALGTGAGGEEDPGLYGCLGDAGPAVRPGVRSGFQPPARLTGGRGRRRPARGGDRVVESPCALQPRPGVVFQERVRGVPQRGRTGRCAQPDGRQLHRLSRRVADLFGGR
jgi:serine/threonine protein kinase/tetratricopeptide (TPR) repeat protein